MPPLSRPVLSRSGHPTPPDKSEQAACPTCRLGGTAIPAHVPGGSAAGDHRTTMSKKDTR